MPLFYIFIRWDEKMSKRKIKKTIKIPLIIIAILISLIAILLSSIGIKTLFNKNDNVSQSVGDNANVEKLADMSDYSSYQEGIKYVYQTSSVDEMLDMLKHDNTFVTLFAYPDCVWSVEAMPIINEVAKANDCIVNYIDINNMGTKDLNNVKEKIGEFMNTNSEGKPTLYTPYIIFVKEGEVVLANVGTVESHNAFERTMNESELMNYKALLDKGFKLLK